MSIYYRVECFESNYLSKEIETEEKARELVRHLFDSIEELSTLDIRRFDGTDIVQSIVVVRNEPLSRYALERAENDFWCWDGV